MKIAILGYGVIGKGVYEIISKKDDIEVIKILEKEEKFDKTKIEIFTNNIESIKEATDKLTKVFYELSEKLT